MAEEQPTHPEPGTVTWRQLVNEMTATFAENDIPHPEISARRIAEQASGLSAADLAVSLHQPVTKRMIAAVDKMIARRNSGEPLQYVVQSWGFRTLDVMVDRRVLIPRPETEEVVGWGLAEVDRVLGSPDYVDQLLPVVDLGTGSGVIGLSVAVERARTHVTITDISTDALAVARANVAGVGRAGARVAAVQGDWFDALDSQLAGTIGVILSNPPYVRDDEVLPVEVDQWEPSQALRAPGGGRDYIDHIFKNSVEWLHPAGAVVVEMAPDQAEVVVSEARQFFAEAEVRNDLSGRSRAVVARFPVSAPD